MVHDSVVPTNDGRNNKRLSMTLFTMTVLPTTTLTISPKTLPLKVHIMDVKVGGFMMEG